ncbi:swr complex subunit [Polyrhizophydium stewartii]|uniref:SWR1-complex protein 4 n=1 Tax=Polyrhizophydium stewartii TaxID=2732419 RepID=A0ABR4NIN6_9FUNG
MLEIQASQTSAFGGPGAGLGDGMSPAAAMARTSSAGSLSGDVVVGADAVPQQQQQQQQHQQQQPHHQQTGEILAEFVLPTLQPRTRPAGLQPVPGHAAADERGAAPAPGAQSARAFRKQASLDASIAALTGGLPPVVLARRWPAASTTCRRWRWQPFTNSARTDSLALGHWSSDPNEADSRFAAQGVQAQVMRFTDEEYDTHLKDPAWSKEDTEHLFALCRELELRFYVIADRFEGSTPRTIEDLKDRYYSVSRALVAARHGAQDPQGKLMTAKYAYDKTREIERRRIIEKLLSRTPEQIEEEEILMHELKKRAASEESWNRERELILRSLMNNELPPQTAVPLVPLSTDPRKKRRPLRGDETPMMAQGVDAIRRRNRDREVDDSPLRKEKLPCGAFLRTSRIQPIKISLQTRATALLDEYRIGARPNMPTAAVCAKFDEVRQLAVALLETKKLVDKAEHELKVAHIRRKTLKDDLAGGRKPAAAAGPALSAPLAGKRPLVSPPVQREHKRARN